LIAAALLLLAQTAAPAEPQRWSILRDEAGTCQPSKTTNDDVVVCAGRDADRLPLRDEPRVADRSRGPIQDARAGLERMGTPCAVRQEGCQVGFGPSLPQIVGAVKAIGRAIAGSGVARDTAGERVPIPLDAPPQQR
jgi:hypothetical protein